MTAWSVHQLVEATGGQLVRGEASHPVSGISIDSRCLTPGEVFVAIEGTRFDGHRFVGEAAARGASCLIVSHRPADGAVPSGIALIEVDDTTQALGDLARYHRRRLGTRVIGVTGSCGKTTTKELIAHLLGSPDTVLKTVGTQNNHIGVPLTLLRLTEAHQNAVVEMGTNHPGEIAYLGSIVEPDVALLTNVGPVHLEFLGSLMGVMREKLSLLDYVPADGIAVLPGDQLDVYLEAKRLLEPTMRHVTFGASDRCDIQALDIQRAVGAMKIRLRDQLGQWVAPMLGYHNVENVLAAVACTWALGVPLSAARERLRSFQPVPLRSQVVQCKGLTILNDCYNANPLSFARALEMLRDLDVRRRVVIVGDMLELGTYAPAAHEAIGRLATQMGVATIIAVGEFAERVAMGARQAPTIDAWTYRTVNELMHELPNMLQEGDGLLVKGSRKLNLERITEFLVARDQKAGHVGIE